MSNRLGTIAGIAVGIVVVTYVVLNLVKPFKQHDEQLPAGAKVDEVFASDISSAPVPAQPAAEVAAATPSSAGSTAHGVPDIAVPPDNQAPPKPAAEAPTAKDAPKEGAVEIEGASDFPMPDDSAPAAAPETTVAAAAPPAAPAAQAEPPAAPLPRPTPDPVVVPTAPPAPAAAVASAEPAAPAEAAPEPFAPAEAAPPAPLEKPRPAAPKAAVVAKSAPRADVLRQWWPERSTPGQLNLLYAGQAANERSVGLLFDSSFAESADFASTVKLLADNGQPAKGAWELNSNRRMLLFKGLKSGRYTVVVEPLLANEGGLKIGKELRGPIYIR